MNMTTREFTAHEALLRHYIFHQAGSREKAALEGVMNSIDAGATKVEVELKLEGMIIKDDGRGFQSEEEVRLNFEQFGRPHDDKDHAVYGKFRMGRGQLFAFGRNLWRTRTFELTVDAKESVSYDLVGGLSDQVGCTIEVTWYDPLYPNAMHRMLEEMRTYFKYMQVPVFVNGQQVNRPPAGEKWDDETEHYYIKFNSRSSVEVYNLGAYVRSYGAHNYGTGAVVVSKRRLDVNFARNDILENDPTWRAIQARLRKEAGRATKTRRTGITDSQREYWLENFLAGDVDREDFADLKVFTDVTGRHWSWVDIERHIRDNGISKLCFARPGDTSGDRLQQNRQALVLSQYLLDRSGITPKMFLERLREGELLGATRLQLAAIEVEAKTLARLQTIPKEQWTTTEQAFIKNFDCYTHEILARAATGKRRSAVRSLRMGDAEPKTLAWTDGVGQITLNRRALKGAKFDDPFWYKWSYTLLHEYCHDDSNIETHVHTPEFYTRFHDEADHAAELGNILSERWARRVDYTRQMEIKRAAKMLDRRLRLIDANQKFEVAASELDQAKQLLAKWKKIR